MAGGRILRIDYIRAIRLNIGYSIVPIYGLNCLPGLPLRPNLLFFAALVLLDKGIDPQSQWQRLPGIQFHQRLQNLGVYMFRRFIRPNILSPKNSPHTNHSSPKLVRSRTNSVSPVGPSPCSYPDYVTAAPKVTLLV